jgi:hypothetical protein
MRDEHLHTAIISVSLEYDAGINRNVLLEPFFQLLVTSPPSKTSVLWLMRIHDFVLKRQSVAALLLRFWVFLLWAYFLARLLTISPFTLSIAFPHLSNGQTRPGRCCKFFPWNGWFSCTGASAPVISCESSYVPIFSSHWDTSCYCLALLETGGHNNVVDVVQYTWEGDWSHSSNVANTLAMT